MNSKKLQICFCIDLDVTINVCFNVTDLFKEILLIIMLKRVDTSSRFQIIGKAIPRIRSNIG